MQGKIILPEQQKTPLANSLKTICHKKPYSFHALPISSFGHSDILPASENENLCLETTITDEAFDNFFFPQGVIKDSQNLTSQLYNADSSFYITSGTTVANQIAISALYNHNDNVLIDKNCHQSIHFFCQSLGIHPEYLCSDLSTEDQQIKAWSINQLTKKALCKESTGKGYDLIILTAQSYEGLIYDIPATLFHLLNSGISTRKFFIDEAWGSLNYFNEKTRPLTAMSIDHIIDAYPDLEVICTHSAHKSLFCLRQASLIHCKGKAQLASKIEVAKFRIHTTSPNYPILASLDMSQSCMHKYGKELALHAQKLAISFKDSLTHDPLLSPLNTNFNLFPEQWHIYHDPTKVMINTEHLDNAAIIKAKLLKKNIFIKRTLDKHLLLNFHIGINRSAVAALIDALHTITRDSTDKKIIDISEKFIVPYPPGVPMIFPGDEINIDTTRQIESLRDKGSLIVKV